MRTLSNTIVLLAALSPLCTAQGFGARLATADAVGVHANRQIDAARGGTAITSPLQLTATDGRVAGASSTAGPAALSTSTSDAAGARFTWHGAAAPGNRAGTLGGSPLASGAQAYDLQLFARSAVTGAIVVEFGGQTSNGGAGATVAMRGHSFAFRANGTAQRQVVRGVTLDSNGIKIAVHIAGHADASNSHDRSTYAGKLSVLFVVEKTPSCDVKPHLASCPHGGTLRGAAQATSRGGVLTLGLTGALPDAIGVTLVSPSPRAFQIGDSKCIFFAMPIVADTFMTDGHGDAKTALHFPLHAGGQFWVQQATLKVSPRGLAFGTSNSLEVTCK